MERKKGKRGKMAPGQDQGSFKKPQGTGAIVSVKIPEIKRTGNVCRERRLMRKKWSSLWGKIRKKSEKRGYPICIELGKVRQLASIIKHAGEQS